MNRVVVPASLDASNDDIWLGWSTIDPERAPNGLDATNPILDRSGHPVPWGPHPYTMTLTGAAPVPEPASVILLALGGPALILRRRKCSIGSRPAGIGKARLPYRNGAR